MKLYDCDQPFEPGLYTVHPSLRDVYVDTLITIVKDLDISSPGMRQVQVISSRDGSVRLWDLFRDNWVKVA